MPQSPPIRISPTAARSPPSLAGFDVTDTEWTLDPSRYEAFIETTTGLSVTDELSAADCYRIGNRLEALIAERRQSGEWDETLVEEYPDVEHRAEITGLARFFRTCHTCLRAESET